MNAKPTVEINIFGSHCRRCSTFKAIIKKIVQELDINAEIECLGNEEELLRFDVIYLPALAVNGKLLVQGGFPSPKKLKKLIEMSVINSEKE